MSGDKSKRGPANRSRINVNERYEVESRSKELGVSSLTLRDAVKAAGVLVADVERHLDKR